MEHDIPFGNSNRENGTTFLDFPLFLGIFQWDEPTKRVPFTAEPEIPEILTKWKAPKIQQKISYFTNFLCYEPRLDDCFLFLVFVILSFPYKPYNSVRQL